MTDDKKKIGDWQQETYKLRARIIDKDSQIKELKNLINAQNETIKWLRFDDDLNNEWNCNDCNGEIECLNCSIYKDLLEKHGLSEPIKEKLN